jgi:hypothetical protein
MQLGKAFLITVCALAITITASAQIKAVENFLRENEDLDKYFIYQSTLRMLSDGDNPDFNKLIKGIRKINVYVDEDGNAGVSEESYARMIRELSDERFETLVSAKQDDMHLNLMSRENGNDSYYVLAASEGQSFALLEMDGNLDLRYLQSLENMNFSKLRNIVGQETRDVPVEEIRD